MLPEYPKLKNLEISDLKTIEKHLKLAPRSICELNVANFIIWKDFDRAQLTLINKNLCILINPLNEAPYFLEPFGNNQPTETLETCLNHTQKMSRLSENYTAEVKKLCATDKIQCSCLRSQFDYVYLTEKLSELKGKKFDGKRNHIRRFLKRYPENKFVSLEPKHKKEAQSLFEEWFKTRRETRHFTKLAYNSQKRAIEMAFLLFDQLNFSGGALFADNKLMGFILGSPLNSEMISVHFAYGNPHIQGSSQLLLREACQKSFAKFKYVNLEQDIGIPGLRKSKLSWQPHKLERKFEIKPV